MNSKINTSIFLYSSCFAVGTNIERIYKDERQLAKRYSFIIVTQGTTDTTSASASGFPLTNFKVKDIDFSNKKLRIAPELNYNQLIKNFTTISEIANFESAISPIMSSESKAGILEVPHIRLKGGEFFNIADITNKIAVIGNVFAKTCTKVDLAKYFTKKGIVPEYYLVYAPNIPCELIISSVPDAKLYFIPMFTPGLHFVPSLTQSAFETIFEYHIAKITAPSLSLDNIIGMFVDAILVDSNYVRIEIDDLYVQTKTLLKTEHESLKNVIIESIPEPLTKQSSLYCYFMYQNRSYETDGEGNPAIPISHAARKRYNRLKSEKPSLAQPERFEKIRELQKKHIHLQKLQKSHLQGIAQ